MNGPDAARPLLAVARVSKAFVEGPRPIRALHDVSFQVADGEFVCLLGPSGSGKSTLLRIAGGLIAPDQGTVIFDGRPLTEPQPDIGFVFQSTNLMPWRTVLQNVLLPLEIQRGALDDAHTQRALELLRVVGLEGFERAYPKHLSGGMAQRVVLARTLIQQPKLLLMDEPFGALDALTRERMNLELLRVHSMQAATVLMVTHSITEAVFLADRVIILSERPGRIVAETAIDLARPREIGMTAGARYGELAMEVRRYVGNAVAQAGA
ncbi:MAG: ABC transporter ATP-binding protein [Chloroflexota bacterium]|nr:ABC transporter ATP-binding protein [Chloroflexota bacterium]